MPRTRPTPHVDFTTTTPTRPLEGDKDCALCGKKLVWWKRQAVLTSGWQQGRHAHLSCATHGPPWSDQPPPPADPTDPAVIAAATAQLEAYFQAHYRCGLADLRLASTPGYWERLVPCDGGSDQGGTCPHPLHTCLFYQRPMHHTVTFFDSPRDRRGRWCDPTRTWKLLQAATLLSPPKQPPEETPAQ